jgi:hypothetical protein
VFLNEYFLLEAALLGSFEDLDQTPALVFAQWTRFHNANGVARMRVVLLVMSHQPGRFLDKLPINGVFDLTLDRDRDRFLHLVANDKAYTLFSLISSLGFHSFLEAW